MNQHDRVAQPAKHNLNIFGILWPGEFAFFAVKEGKGLKLQADTGDCIIEYITFNKA